MKWFEAAHFERQYKEIADLLHYPGCWDTAAYPTLWDALKETLLSLYVCDCIEFTDPLP